jgi:nicotinamide-nucleotide amidase
MGAFHRTAAIVSTGDEIVIGQRLNTNSRWLAGRLTDLGVLPVEHISVGDDAAALEAALRRLGAAADLVILTGGLGPTADDLTRPALAAAMNEPLVEDAGAIASIQRWFAGRPGGMPRANALQALRPRSGSMLANPNGTAPGIVGRVGEADVFCLPGPPGEMQPMFEADVVPRLRPEPGLTVATRVLPTFGLGESILAERLGPLMDRSANPLVGTTASGGVVTCRIRYAGPLGPGDSTLELDRVEARIRASVGPYVLGTGERTIQQFVVELLRERGRTLTVVESCTGGLLGELVTDVPGSSAVFAGGWLTYSNEMKQRLVGVPAAIFAPGGPGAVSRECAGAMAAGGLERSRCTDCLAITGIAGPLAPGEVENPEKPVGTVWVSHACTDGGTASRRFRFGGDRAAVRDWAARSALAMLRLRLLGRDDLPLMRQIAS